MFRDGRLTPPITPTRKDPALVQFEARRCLLTDGPSTVASVIEAVKRRNADMVRQELGALVDSITAAGIDDDFFDHVSDLGSCFAYEPSAMKPEENQKPLPLTENAVILAADKRIVRTRKNQATGKMETTPVPDLDLLSCGVGLTITAVYRARALLSPQQSPVEQ